MVMGALETLSIDKGSFSSQCLRKLNVRAEAKIRYIATYFIGLFNQLPPECSRNKCSKCIYIFSGSKIVSNFRFKQELSIDKLE